MMKTIIIIIIITTTICLIASFSIFAQGKFGGGDGAGYNSGTANNINLPIELVRFDLSLHSDKEEVLIEWTTVSETNNDFFTVEKSDDKLEWKEVGREASQGESNQVSYYKMKDLFPYEGLSYYRLSQTDFDGTSSRSKIISLSLERTKKQILEIYPNPTGNTIFIKSEGLPNDSELTIRNIYGEIIIQLKQIPSEINMRDFPSGLYFLKLNNQVVKIVKR